MLNIDLTVLKGKTFICTNTKNDPNTEYTCIGVGQNPETGVNYVVGVVFDAPNNRSEIKTELIKDVKFIGNIVQ